MGTVIARGAEGGILDLKWILPSSELFPFSLCLLSAIIFISVHRLQHLSLQVLEPDSALPQIWCDANEVKGVFNILCSPEKPGQFLPLCTCNFRARSRQSCGFIRKPLWPLQSRVPGGKHVGVFFTLHSSRRLTRSLDRLGPEVLFRQSKISEVLGGSGYNSDRLSTPYIPQLTGRK